MFFVPLLQAPTAFLYQPGKVRILKEILQNRILIEKISTK
jgi:hypothetical protein